MEDWDDWSSYDFVNNLDDVFEKSVLGAAFVTYAANQILNHFLAIFFESEAIMFVAWVIVFFLTLYVFAYWGKFFG